MQQIESIIADLRAAVEKRQPLYSVFDSIFIHAKRPKQLSRNPAFKPALLSDGGILKSETLVSPEGIKAEIDCIRNLDENAKTDTVFHLLQKYGWRIGVPDAGDTQDVAFCDSKRVEYALGDQNDGPYLLVKGDLSGIQTYIYGNLKPKVTGAGGDLSKRLRGRSVIISLLTDFLANVILKELDLPAWHMLFAGGGHFNLLLPESKEGELKVLAERLDSEMRRWFGDRLNLVLAWVHCNGDIRNEAGGYFHQVNLEKERKKHQMHRLYLKDHFFPPAPLNSALMQDEREEEIGEKFPKRRLLAEVTAKAEIPPREYHLPVLEFAMHKNHYLLTIIKGASSGEAWENAGRLALSGEKDMVSAQVFTMNDTDFLPASDSWDYAKFSHIGFGFRFMGKTVPMLADDAGQKERPKTFEEITYPDDEPGERPLPESEKKRSFLRLGAVRLDVDDLGCIFSHGLGERASLGQIVCLSREMHYFFTAHFDRLASQKDIYVIYSGGDDAFAVGRWDKLISFVRELNRDFKEFILNNNDLHFSAGIFLGDPRYPVGKFYRDAGALLETAKEPSIKNRVNVFDQTLSWPEFEGKITLGADFAEILKAPKLHADVKITLSFANRILRLVKSSFHEQACIDEYGQKVRRGFMDVSRFAKNIAGVHYLFARHGYTQDELTKVKGDIHQKLTVDFIKSFNRDAIGKPRKIDQLRNYLVAFNFALYSIRSQKKIKKTP